MKYAINCKNVLHERDDNNYPDSRVFDQFTLYGDTLPELAEQVKTAEIVSGLQLIKSRIASTDRYGDKMTPLRNLRESFCASSYNNECSLEWGEVYLVPDENLNVYDALNEAEQFLLLALDEEIKNAEDKIEQERLKKELEREEKDRQEFIRLSNKFKS